MAIEMVIIKKEVFSLQMEPSKCVFEDKVHKPKTNSLKITIKLNEVIDSLPAPNYQRTSKSNHYFQLSIFPQRQKTTTSKHSITTTPSSAKINPTKIHYITQGIERDTVNQYQANRRRKDH